MAGRDLDQRDLQGDEEKAHLNNPEHEVCFLIISCGETSTSHHLETPADVVQLILFDGAV